MEKIQKSAKSLQFLDDLYKKNKTIVRLAISRDPKTFEFASTSLKSDHEFVKELMKKNIYVLSKASYELRDDPDYIYDLYHIYGPDVVYYMSDELKSDYKFIKKLLQSGGFSYIVDIMPAEMKDDPKVMKSLAKVNPNILIYASENIKNNEDFFKELIDINQNVFFFASDKIQNNRYFYNKMKDYQIIYTPSWISLNKHYDLKNIMFNRQKFKKFKSLMMNF